MVTVAVRRRSSWMVLLSLTLIVMAFAFAACGGDSGTGTSNNNNNNATPAGSKSVQTVNVKESKANGQADVYTCDPTSISIKKGDTVTFTNMSDENQDFDQGDAQKAGVDFVIGLNQSHDVVFNTAGTFTITSEKNASITVTVQ